MKSKIGYIRGIPYNHVQKIVCHRLEKPIYGKIRKWTILLINQQVWHQITFQLENQIKIQINRQIGTLIRSQIDNLLK